MRYSGLYGDIGYPKGIVIFCIIYDAIIARSFKSENRKHFYVKARGFVILSFGNDNKISLNEGLFSTNSS